MLKKIITFFFALQLTVSSFAHSGNTNADGCHSGSQPYHCHNSKDNSSGDNAVLRDSLVAIIGVMIVIGIVNKTLNRNKNESTFDHESNPQTNILPILKLESNKQLLIGFQYNF